MIRFQALGTEFRMHVLTLLAAALAVALNGGEALGAALPAMAVHEAAHLIAARAFRLPIESVEIMPFGGAARLSDLYGAPGPALTVMALAGPAANALAALCVTALANRGLLPYGAAEDLIRMNLALMLFNLMPALPLDGGRALYAMLRRPLGPRTALRIGAGMAYLLSALLLGLAVWNLVREGALNLTLVILPVFLIASSQSELRSARCAAVSRAVKGLCNAPELPSRARIVALSADTPAHDAARFLRTGETTLFAVVEEGGVREWLTGQGLAGRIVDAE